MTDKQSFLDKLNAALVERGISDTDIAPYIERFDRFYDRMVSESGSTSKSLEDVNAIADNIAAQISDRYDEMNRLAERTMTMDAVKTEASDAPSDDISDEIASEDEVIDADNIPDFDDQPTAEADIAEITEMAKAMDSAAEPEEVEPTAPAMPVPVEETANSEPPRLPDYVEEEPLGDTKTFYIIFFATLPITAILGLAGLILFAGVWSGLAALIVGLMGALIGVAAVGTTLSLVGIVYGIIQLFESVPVGLYEIGLGVLIAGAVMLAGILIYNLAIRLMPFLIKLVYKLFKFVIKKLKDLFKYLRKESAKL